MITISLGVLNKKVQNVKCLKMTEDGRRPMAKGYLNESGDTKNKSNITNMKFKLRFIIAVNVISVTVNFHSESRIINILHMNRILIFVYFFTKRFNICTTHSYTGYIVNTLLSLYLSLLNIKHEGLIILCL